MTNGRVGEKNAAVLFILLAAFDFFYRFNIFQVVSTLHITPGKQIAESERG